MQFNFFWPKVVEVYEQVFSMLKKNPTILFPFILLGVIDFAALFTLFLAPSPPFSYILAPIIREFWGERFLHYPGNLIILPKIFGYANLVILSIVGVFMTAIVVKKIEEQNKGLRISTLSAAQFVWGSYFSLFVVWLVSYLIASGILKLAFPILPRNLWIQFFVILAFWMFTQAIFGFLIPAILILRKGLVQGSLSGLRFGFKHCGITTAMIFIPMLVAGLVSLLKIILPALTRQNPEIILVVLSIGIVVSLATDLLITSSMTILFLELRSKGEA